MSDENGVLHTKLGHFYCVLKSSDGRTLNTGGCWLLTVSGITTNKRIG